MIDNQNRQSQRNHCLYYKMECSSQLTLQHVKSSNWTGIGDTICWLRAMKCTRRSLCSSLENLCSLLFVSTAEEFHDPAPHNLVRLRDKRAAILSYRVAMLFHQLKLKQNYLHR